MLAWQDTRPDAVYLPDLKSIDAVFAATTLAEPDYNAV